MKNDMKFPKEDIFKIPNILTYIRILMVPVFVIVYLNARTLSAHIWSVVIVILTEATDVVDGYIARKYNMITDLGKIIDPIADKAIQFAMLFCVIVRYHKVWILLIIYAVKELVSLAFSAYLFRRGKHIAGANWAGKLCSVILFLVLLTLIAVPSVPDNIVNILILVGGIFMLLAFAVYMTAYVKLLLELKQERRG